MSNHQVESGHIRIQNELWDALVGIRISGEARQVLDFIIRKTWGWGKKKDCIPLSQFKKATGLKKPTIIKARKKLIEMNLITVTQKDNAIALIYSVNKDFDKWKPLPKKVTVTQKGKDRYPKSKLPLPKKLPSIDTSSKDTSSKDNSLVVFNFWNSQNIIPHRDINGCLGEINARLVHYSPGEINEAIKNYASILHSADYVFSYRWTLKDFLVRKNDNISRFMSRSKPFDSFPKTKSYHLKKEKERQIKELEDLDKEDEDEN
jgi:phage replication O-like protein O